MFNLTQQDMHMRYAKAERERHAARQQLAAQVAPRRVNPARRIARWTLLTAANTLITAGERLHRAAGSQIYVWQGSDPGALGV